MRVYRLPGGPQIGGWFSGLSFSPDSRRLAVNELQTRVRWLDLESGEVTRTLSLPQSGAVTVSSDHSLLGVGRLTWNQANQQSPLIDRLTWNQASRPSTLIERYELPNPNPALTWEIPNYYPRAAACAPDGSGFAITLDNREPYAHSLIEGEFPNAMCGWDGRTGSKIGPVSLSWWTPATLSFSPDGWRLACAGRTGRVLMLDWPSGEQIGEFFAPSTERIRFAPHRPHLAVVAKKSVVVLDASEVQRRSNPVSVSRVATLQRGHRDRVTDIAFAPSGELLLTVSADTTARVWNLAKKRCTRCFEWGIGPLTAAAWSADGTLCAAAGANGQIVVWDAEE